MTLREKFEEVNILDYRFRERDLDSETFYVDAEKCEKIAEDFAIGFAEWYLKISEKYDSYLKLKNDTKELLEIYKNEIKR